MIARFIQTLMAVFIIALGCVGVHAQGQGADDKSLFSRNDPDEFMSKGLRETREKMRIEKEKKDHDEMLQRGEEVRRLSERVQRSFTQNGRLSDTDIAALENVEKSVKKIRDELGGSDDDEKIDEVMGPDKTPGLADAVDKLKTAATELVDDLKKTTRFTISATAIHTSNTVLTVARFLRIKN